VRQHQHQPEGACRRAHACPAVRCAGVGVEAWGAGARVPTVSWCVGLRACVPTHALCVFNKNATSVGACSRNKAHRSDRGRSRLLCLFYSRPCRCRGASGLRRRRRRQQLLPPARGSRPRPLPGLMQSRTPLMQRRPRPPGLATL